MIATVCIVGSAYVLTSSEGANQSTANTSQQATRTELPAPEQLAKGEPVRFANPFDTAEVFEFPAETTEIEARDAVAEAIGTRNVAPEDLIRRRLRDVPSLTQGFPQAAQRVVRA